MLALHTGMRVGEICSLQAKDIRSSHSVNYFDVAENFERRLKTKSASRLVPVHHKLVALGFLDWVEAQGYSGDDLLFSELSLNSDGNRGDAFSKWFGFLRKSVGVVERGRGIHAFRHLFADLLRETNPRREHLHRIMGWSQGDMLDVYGDGKTVKLFNEYVQKIEFRDYDITHLAR
ncbi:MAG: tyrosine-type recombinase/integrase [Henriciella sp.]|nr:tyrosine-type recombinase/integrase [Henriciella sp.]